MMSRPQLALEMGEKQVQEYGEQEEEQKADDEEASTGSGDG